MCTGGLAERRIASAFCCPEVLAGDITVGVAVASVVDGLADGVHCWLWFFCQRGEGGGWVGWRLGELLQASSWMWIFLGGEKGGLGALVGSGSLRGSMVKVGRVGQR